MGLSQRPSHSTGDFERSLADGVAHAVFDDHFSCTWKPGLPPDPAGCAGERARRFPIPASATTEERKDITSIGYPWPGDWTLERDEANHRATVRWKGKAETDYPWGKEVDYESLTYNVDDAHPELSPVHGEAESIFTLKGASSGGADTCPLTTDQKNFYYKYTRELLKDGQMVKQKTWEETIPRDHQ